MLIYCRNALQHVILKIGLQSNFIVQLCINAWKFITHISPIQMFFSLCIFRCEYFISSIKLLLQTFANNLTWSIYMVQTRIKAFTSIGGRFCPWALDRASSSRREKSLVCVKLCALIWFHWQMIKIEWWKCVKYEAQEEK